ncbi:MAG: ATP-grasp domain-containing protein [Clostridia bacterium]|nr:ATP-grasp domain-containing protein [Clostridia bacterium]
MTAWIIYQDKDAKKNKAYIERFTAEAQTYGVTLSCVLLEDLFPDLHQLPENKLFEELPDFVINRSRSGKAAAYFESNNCRVFNPAVVSSICNDKMLTYQLAARHHIPMMETCYTQEDAFSLGFPLVVKPACGHGGHLVSYVRNADELISIINQIHADYGLNCHIIYQKCASDPARDLRVYLLNKKILACMLRQGNDKADIRSNYSLGGQAKQVSLSSEEERLVFQIAELLPFDCVGIDFIYHMGHPIFNEIEDAVGARMLYAHTDIDIVSSYMKYIYESMNS